jgi:hypothetical protein
MDNNLYKPCNRRFHGYDLPFVCSRFAVTKVITPKKNTLATTYAIIAGRFTIKLKMIGYIVRIVDDTSKDQHALISTRRK